MPEITDINTICGPLPVAGTNSSIEQLLALMGKHEVGRAFVTSTLGLLLDPQVGNSITRATCADVPNLLPAAILNPLYYFGESQELHALQADGFRMVRFFPHTQSWPISSAAFRAVIRALAPLGLPVMVQTRRLGEPTELQTVLHDYPAPVILSEVDTNTLSEAIAVLREQPQWFMETSQLLAPGAIRLAASCLGADRLLFGSGALMQPVGSVLRTLEFADLSGQELELILHRNAERLFVL